MKPITIVAIGLNIFLAGPAQAGFAYTDWGMTPSQVVAAAKGEATVDPNPETTPAGAVSAVIGTYASGTRRFDSRFDFTDGKLSGVLLTQTQGDCGTLLAELFNTYGTPSKQGSVLSLTVWNDPKKGNVVNYLAVDGVCKIGYRPLVGYSPNGL